MLECKCCNYLKNKKTPAGANFHKCEFSGHVFIGERGFDLSEYPCHDLSYDDYLERCGRRAVEPEAPREGFVPPAAAARSDENKEHRLTGDDWHFLYLKKHRIPSNG